MTTETMPASGVAAEQVTPVPANETPEVAAPEVNEAEQQPQEEAKKDADSEHRRTQRRIDRLTKARYEEAAARQQAERQAAELAARLEALERQTRGDQEPDQRTPVIDENAISERIKAEAKALIEQEAISKRSHEIRASLVKELGEDGFTELISEVTDEAGPLADERGKWTPLGELIADSDNPAAILKYLKDNPDEAAALNGLSAPRLGKRIAAIELAMAKPKEPQPSKAPKPLTPVKGGSSSPGEPDPKNTAAWIAWRNKQPRRGY